MQNTNRQTGFTLIEMAIVIAIIGIVLGGLLKGFSALRENSQLKQDQYKLNDIQTALLSYVAVNGYLPCPDTDVPADGLENRQAEGFCNSTAGTLPYADLTTHSMNSYGHRFSYHVNRHANQINANNSLYSASYFGSRCADQSAPPCFTNQTPPTANFPSMANFAIDDGANQRIANHVSLVVISHGQNGCNLVNGFEAENCKTTPTTYYQAPQNREGNLPFDDALIWLSSLQIKHASRLWQNTDNSAISSIGLPFNELTDPDDRQFDHETGGDYDADSDVINANPTDSIKINGDVNRNLSLLNDEATLYVIGQLNAVVSGGNQNKSIFINGDVNSDLNLSGGDNKIQINGNIHPSGSITSGNGADTLIVYGNVAGVILLDKDNNGRYNSVYIGGEVSADVSAKGTAYLNQIPGQLDDAEYNHLANFSLILCRQTIDSNVWIACR